MAIEIERKFLLTNDSWREEVTRSERMVQGYISRSEDTAIRVRITDQQAHINVKKSLDGIHRMEYEYDIPLTDAQEMLDKVALPTPIDKVRHYIVIEDTDLVWEIDEFFGDNKGLIVAEIELVSIEQDHPKPLWLGDEVSQDKRYFNNQLSLTPYNSW